MPDKNATTSSEPPSALNATTGQNGQALSPPWYYTLVIKLLKPLYRIALWRRHNKANKTGLPVADYKSEIDARYGRRYPLPPRLATATEVSERTSAFYNTLIWCHAVSLGETNTIAPMLKQMLKQGARLWITNTTQTGFARTEALFAEAIAAGQVVHTFVPVDDKAVIQKFVDNAKPDLAMFVETELWANILAVLKQSNIPSVLVNARLSQKSYDNYAKHAAVSKGMVHNLTMIIAQDADSAKRFRYLGTDVVKIRRANSLKWSTGSMQPKPLDQLRSEFAANTQALQRPIWVAGSTHDGEETAVLNAHKQLLTQPHMANALLILVPRHPERFDAVAELIEQTGLNYRRRSEQQLIDADTQVYLADTMGELGDCYELSDVALVGGSLVNIGGHNPIEAASLAKPIIMGPYTQSCHELVSELSAAGALVVVDAAEGHAQKRSNKQSATKGSDGGQTPAPQSTLLQAVLQWLAYPEQAQRAGKLGAQLVAKKSDAMQKQLAMIESLLIKKQIALSAKPDPKQEPLDLDYFKVRTRSDSSDMDSGEL
ncbi:3-deoxy-D-manno-octulosonic acid transferase [Psychrobacter sp. H7-1]|uniref:3-deoxy-D-manno-octulosonic acid transferase n=1 Tax=Psychrobacter sp. H7-1 TaxID=1569265 RepID=UPI001917C7AB|nr:3-deoxy-D-manno-octulosonic acid transferase [Psychrobacter sp. H7-1]